MAELTPTIGVDTREQRPWDFTLPTQEVTLQTGDVTVIGLERLVCAERKSLSDLLGCIGHGRDRFERELERLRAYPYRMVVVEDATLATIAAGGWRSQLKPSHVIGAIAAWQARYALPFVLAPDRAAAVDYVQRWILTICRDAERQAKALEDMRCTSTQS